MYTCSVPKIPGNLSEWVLRTKTADKVYTNMCSQKLYVSRYRRATSWPQSLDFYLLGYLQTPVNSVPTAHEQALHQRIFDARQPVCNLHETFKIIRQSMIRGVNACIDSGGRLLEHLQILIYECLLRRHSSPYCCWSLWWISADGTFSPTRNLITMRCSTLRGTFCSLIALATPRQDWTGSNPSRREGGGCGFTLSRSHSCCAVRLVYIQISPVIFEPPCIIIIIIINDPFIFLVLR